MLYLKLLNEILGFPGGATVKNPPAKQETQVRSLGGEDPLEQEMATHADILAWEVPWTEEPGGLQSLGSHRVRHVFSITSFNSSGYTARSGITGFYVSFIFNFLRTL